MDGWRAREEVMGARIDGLDRRTEVGMCVDMRVFVHTKTQANMHVWIDATLASRGCSLMCIGCLIHGEHDCWVDRWLCARTDACVC